MYIMSWIEEINSDWKGHRPFAEWLVANTKNDVIVELGMDYGYSTFVFANTLQNYENSKVYSVDLFTGFTPIGEPTVYDIVINTIKNNNITNVEIIRSFFKDVSATWSKPINILHIDGYDNYDTIKDTFDDWIKHLDNDGVVLIHDTNSERCGCKNFFRELTDGYKLYFNESLGLGIYTKNKTLYENILSSFTNVYDFSTTPF